MPDVPAVADTANLTILGGTVREPVAHVECFPAPAHVRSVRFTTDELSSMCPVTNQPDLSQLVIEYEPDAWCVESKSLKLYLWSFRDRAVFAEALAAEIAGEVMATARPKVVVVTLTQRPRGGIEVRAVAELP
jgi:7-cyano-7-deazaguanine reductase